MVFDKGAGDDLKRLVKEHYLWVAYSPENQRVVEEIWEEGGSDQDWRAATIGVPEYESPDRRVQIEVSVDSAIEHIPAANRIVFFGIGEDDHAFVDGLMAEREFRRLVPASFGRYVRVVPAEKT